ncbi:MAG: glycoside hydrolase family 9 protein [Chitinophagaceae bacterium]|nr:glycoside hydrolase family 9 protein [Chitinophagaceae bacterium]
MHYRLPILLCIALFNCIWCSSHPPGSFSKHIKIDQFGYLPFGKKVAVIVDPQVGYNASESFSPGTGTNQYQVRNWTTDAVVFSGTLTVWNSGNTQAQSGDKGWWFDFSAVTASGSYYIYDVANNVGSYRFEINDNVYKEVLKQACRMYFYQRVNFAKQPPYTYAKWADDAAFSGANQDYAARSRWDKTNNATAKDLHGGWFDAGDFNKYTTFTLTPVCNLLETYRMHPSYFADDYNIPESGNGIPDILDEVKWELDWLTRMQDATGTGGLFLKLGADNYNSSSPPSTDHNPRYYLPECTSATLTGAVNFALASMVYKSLGDATMITYGNDLLLRAEAAWNRAKVTTSNFTTFETACDDQNIVSGDADADEDAQKELVIAAAAYLFEATGNTSYRDVFDGLYTSARPIAYYWWGPYYQALQRALLRYTKIPSATTAVVNNILTVKAAQNDIMSINDYNNTTDLYRAYMPDDQYTWGSNETKASAGLDNFDFVTFGINASQSALYMEVGESYLHWFHGINPMGKVMLTNMYAYGGDSCVNEFYHSWFGDGTPWDNVFTSLYGPAPGYLPGGPNKNFSVPSISPPGNQPPQKSFREWNTGWNGTMNENSWEITEAGIYTQSAYISLLVRAIANRQSSALPLHRITLTGERKETGVDLQWLVDDVSSSKLFNVERSADRVHFNAVGQVLVVNNMLQYYFTDASAEAKNAARLYYRIKETGLQGETHYSAIVALQEEAAKDKIKIYPNPADAAYTLAGYAATNAAVELKMFDVSGKTVYYEKWQQAKGYYVKNISINSLSPGIYWVQINGPVKTGRIKLIKR